MIDLETELTNANMYKHSLKRNFNRMSRYIEKISSALFKGVAEQISRDFCNLYNDTMEKAMESIDKRILLPQPEKAYNIILSLSRLTLKANNGIGRYKQKYIEGLDLIPKMLECGLKDYNLDIVIEQALNEVALP